MQLLERTLSRYLCQLHTGSVATDPSYSCSGTEVDEPCLAMVRQRTHLTPVVQNASPDTAVADLAGVVAAIAVAELAQGMMDMPHTAVAADQHTSRSDHS